MYITQSNHTSYCLLIITWIHYLGYVIQIRAYTWWISMYSTQVDMYTERGGYIIYGVG